MPETKYKIDIFNLITKVFFLFSTLFLSKKNSANKIKKH